MSAGVSKYNVINLSDLDAAFAAGEEVTLEAVQAKNLLRISGRQRTLPLKVGCGEEEGGEGGRGEGSSAAAGRGEARGGSGSPTSAHLSRRWAWASSKLLLSLTQLRIPGTCLRIVPAPLGAGGGLVVQFMCPCHEPDLL
jgi:hypothetical protein